MAGSTGRSSDGAMRGLVGAGPSKVGISGSMRARDVSQPTSEDVSRAGQEVVLRRRANPAPPKPGPRAKSTPTASDSASHGESPHDEER